MNAKGVIIGGALTFSTSSCAACLTRTTRTTMKSETTSRCRCRCCCRTCFASSSSSSTSSTSSPCPRLCFVSSRVRRVPAPTRGSPAACEPSPGPHRRLRGRLAPPWPNTSRQTRPRARSRVRPAPRGQRRAHRRPAPVAVRLRDSRPGVRLDRRVRVGVHVHVPVELLSRLLCLGQPGLHHLVRLPLHGLVQLLLQLEVLSLGEAIASRPRFILGTRVGVGEEERAFAVIVGVVGYALEEVIGPAVGVEAFGS